MTKPESRKVKDKHQPGEEAHGQPPQPGIRKRRGRTAEESVVSKKSKTIPKKRGAPKKDPTAPKRPLPAFLAFSNNKKAALKQKNPSLTNKDLSQILAKEWRELPERTRQRYRREEHSKIPQYRVATSRWKEEKKKRDGSINQMPKRERDDDQQEEHAPDQSHAHHDGSSSTTTARPAAPPLSSLGANAASALSQASAILPGMGTSLGAGLLGAGGALTMAATSTGLVGANPTHQALQPLPLTTHVGQQLFPIANAIAGGEGSIETGDDTNQGHQEQEQPANANINGGLMNTSAAAGSVNPMFLLQDQSSALAQQVQNLQSAALQTYLQQQQQAQQPQFFVLAHQPQTAGQIPLLTSGNTATTAATNLLGQHTAAQAAHSGLHQAGTQLVMPTVITHAGAGAANPLNTLVQQQVLLQQQPAYTMNPLNLSIALPTDNSTGDRSSINQQASSLLRGDQATHEQH